MASSGVIEIAGDWSCLNVPGLRQSSLPSSKQIQPQVIVTTKTTQTIHAEV